MRHYCGFSPLDIDVGPVDCFILQKAVKSDIHVSNFNGSGTVPDWYGTA